LADEPWNVYTQPTLENVMLNPYQRPITMAQPQPQGPQMPMQWQPMPEQNQNTGADIGTAAGGISALLKRFKKPNTGMIDSPMPAGYGAGPGFGGDMA
jgi:hypothetical protein